MQSFVLYVTCFVELPYHLSVSSNVTDSRIDKIAILRVSKIETRLWYNITNKILNKIPYM